MNTNVLRSLPVCALTVFSVIVAEAGYALAQQPTITPTAISCPGAPRTRLAVNAPAIVTPGLPNKLRSAPNASSTVLAKVSAYYRVNVTAAPVCAEGFVWWPVSYQGADQTQPLTGWMAEGDNSGYFLQPETTPPIVFSFPDGITTQQIIYQSVSFTYTEALAGVLGNTIQAVTVHAEKAPTDAPSFDIAEHVEFSLKSQQTKTNTDQPVLSVYETHDPAPLDTKITPQVNLIRGLLQQKPDAASLTVICGGTGKQKMNLFDFHSDQWFGTLHKYIKFADGEGIRYVGLYSDNLPYKTSGEITYTVQALTNDGMHLVTAMVPLSVSGFDAIDSIIPNPPNSADPKLNDVLNSYCTAATQKLQQMQPADFAPNLDDLDALIASVQVK